MERQSMLFYKSYIDAVEQIDDEGTQFKLLKAIINYGLTGEADVPDDPLVKMAWIFIEPLLGANIKNYLNGKKGGAPEGNQNNRKSTKSQPNSTQSQPKSTCPKPNSTESQGNVNDNVKDKDKVNDNENVNVNDKDNVKDTVLSSNISDPAVLDEDDDDGAAFYRMMVEQYGPEVK